MDNDDDHEPAGGKHEVNYTAICQHCGVQLFVASRDAAETGRRLACGGVEAASHGDPYGEPRCLAQLSTLFR